MKLITKNYNNYIIPNKDYINNQLEVLGYEYYFPEKLFYTLLNLCCFYFFENNKNCYNLINSDFDQLVFNLLNSLDLEFYICNDPVEMSINILKDLSHNIDFRKYEKGLNFNTSSSNELILIENDFIISGSNINYDFLKILNTLNKEFSHIKSNNFTLKNKFNNIKKNQDFLKCNKSNWLRPDFNLKLFNKTLKCNIDNKIYNENILIYLEDGSSSIFNNEHSFNCLKAINYFLNSINITIHYYRFYDNKYEFNILSSLEQKKVHFNKDKKFYISSCDYTNLFKHIFKTYQNGNVIIFSDTNDNIKTDIKTSLKINFINPTKFNNPQVNYLTKLTGGKHIKI